MSINYSLKNDGSFVVKDYNRAYPFSNFLPGIAGVWGIPLWVFYTNRGQGIASFGIGNKDHAITEFFPANKAYSLASCLGFRTFIKKDSKGHYEPFSPTNGNSCQEMLIESDSFQVREVNKALGISVRATYFTLPNMPVGSLVRILAIKNISSKKREFEVIDGLPRIVPFGSVNSLLKDMSRTLEGWMHSKIENNLASFRLIVDPRDVSHTRYIEGANFNYAFYENKGKKIFPYFIVDPAVLFGSGTTYRIPFKFLEKKFKTPLKQIYCGRTPCAFSHFKWELSPGQEKDFYSLFGAYFKEDSLVPLFDGMNSSFMLKKQAENKRLIEDIKYNAFCVSSSKEFNNYLSCTYLDNVLRGGYPYSVEADSPASGLKHNNNSRGRKNSRTYYIFSRKHGDLERDYNYFQLLPSYFSEGEANYRDINQNRRMDLFFNPSIGQGNIIYFFNLIKIDGYNPLTVKGEKIYFNKVRTVNLLKEFKIYNPRLVSLMVKGFYVGEFFRLMEDEGLICKRRVELAETLISQGYRETKASHSDGYWIDHWHYNLDLIESFLYFYPEKLEELFLENNYVFWDDEHRIRSRSNRYILRGKTVYQGESVEASKNKRMFLRGRERFRNYLRTRNGQVYKTNLASKLLVLILNKFTTLDPYGLGIEMEAGKPGWCDSLNGLPAIFGSSLCGTFALKRAVLFLLSGLTYLKTKGVKNIAVPSEVATFFKRTESLLLDHLSSSSRNRDYIWWDKSNTLKEDFRSKTFFNISGSERKLEAKRICRFLKNAEAKLNRGIKKAKDKRTSLPLTYFTYKVKKYSLANRRVMPLEFEKQPMPLFLEGVVHALRVEKGAKALYGGVKASPLYDKKLRMYKLSSSLKEQPLEIGRSRVFVPGWLENESVWLHMEYKYFLELIKRGLVNEFFSDFKNCGVCFLNPRQYGRSTLENSSFIVSTVYPDKSLWGKGFVARLSGATAEMLNIWIVLCLGIKPFSRDRHNNLCLSFSPLLKGELFSKKSKRYIFKGKSMDLPKNTFVFKLFSKVLVVYHNPLRTDTFKKNCKLQKIELSLKSGEKVIFNRTLKSPWPEAVRRGEVERIDVFFK